MSLRTFIEMTYQPDAWKGDIHQCEGWIARWEWGDRTFVGWAETRKKSYNKALRALQRMQKDEERRKAITHLVMDVEMAIERAVAAGVKRKMAYRYIKEVCINNYAYNSEETT